MTFTVDTCVVIAVINKFDFFHKRSRKLLEKREDDLIIAFSVLNEALTTFLRKFNNVSKKIIYILRVPRFGLSKNVSTRFSSLHTAKMGFL
jgi:predicted nucleic acid-binding protein